MTEDTSTITRKTVVTVRTCPPDPNPMGRAAVEFAYDQDAIDVLKSVTQPEWRTWDPKGKRWLVEVGVVPEVEDALRAAGYQVTHLYCNGSSA